MTYEKAIEIMNSKICYNLLGCMDGICKHTDEKPCAVQMAIEASEKQIPKKPHPIKVAVDRLQVGNARWGKGTIVYRCPDCETYMSRLHDYCFKCGQKIDWSDAE